MFVVMKIFSKMGKLQLTSHSSGPADAGRLTPALYIKRNSGNSNGIRNDYCISCRRVLLDGDFLTLEGGVCTST